MKEIQKTIRGLDTNKVHMTFSLIICTYKRASSLKELLNSVLEQSLYPDEIIIVDGSPDQKTLEMLQECEYKNLIYHKVKSSERGLTKQRNIGVELRSKTSVIIAFLDDDIILEPSYFNNLLETYKKNPEAIAVGGYINNELNWIDEKNTETKSDFYCFDGYCRTESKRFKLRKKLGLAPNRPPCYLPKFSHGRSVGHIPPTGKIYKVEQFMGGVSSYKADIFKKIKFSNYFEGYGLYEDADFCFRLLKFGKLYVNTSAKCQHHHHPSGRPNRFKYGKMVVRNGWYVWRLRWSNPGIKNIFKWHSTTLVLAFLRFLNTFTTEKKVQAFTESIGRFLAWFELFFNKPKIER